MYNHSFCPPIYQKTTEQIPISLSKSLQGKYFVGLSREKFGADKHHQRIRTGSAEEEIHTITNKGTGCLKHYHLPGRGLLLVCVFGDTQ